MCPRSWRAPSAQFNPTAIGRACITEVQNASTVWPESVRPEASVMVPEMTSGMRSPAASYAASTPKMAALALSVSKIVSMTSRSAPPAMRPSAASW